MVLPGTFMPFFFPLGIAFMGAQSAVMMKMAGEQWQYGKRRISAMKNEDFNKLTAIKLYQIETNELREMIPIMKKSFEDMAALNPMIVNGMITMAKDFVQTLLNEAQKGGGIGAWVWRLLFQIPGEPGDVSTPPPPPELPPSGNDDDTEFPDTKFDDKKLTEKEKQENVNKTLQDYLDLKISKRIVPTGTTRKQAMSAVQKYEDLIRTLNLKLKNLLNKPTSANVANSINNIKKLIKIYITARNHFKKALVWLNRNHPLTTP